MLTTIATLCFIRESSQVLLIKKKRGLGEGFFNGPGGKVDSGETPKECIVREVQEEIGLKPLNVINKGLLDFYFGASEEPDWQVHIFVTNEYRGILIETEEAKPFWFNEKEIPYGQMWEDDQYWLPLVLKGKYVQGTFWFSEDLNKLLNYAITSD